jgi:hypothetical protein
MAGAKENRKHAKEAKPLKTIPNQKKKRGNPHASGFSSGATAPHCSSSADVAFESTPPSLAWPFAGPEALMAACE